ncbi:formate dehydrogenase subunit delta [Dokdonella sp.]|uniref:formate dehydrogenase subunit delta n=1 Tax=Dokdonella sp. TaxID=2291710 RepID=UPI00260F736D|nr:formate dehydrogenase subunit delta [Dokdonella sp.]
MSSTEHLVKMANDTADYFASEPDRAAATSGIAQHLRRFWEPRMRRRIGAHLEAGGEGLNELALAGVRELVAMERVEMARGAGKKATA